MRRIAIAAAVLACAALPAHSARPMVTDDARVVDAKACQLESWTRRNPDSTEYWALPACNFTGNLELTFGGSRTNDAEGSAFTDEVLQAKTVLRKLETGGWGAAFTLGTVRHPHRETANGWPGDAYVNVPLSVSMLEDRWIAHFNAGASWRRDTGRTVATWGFGNELLLHPRLSFIPEVFHSETGKAFYQVGLRYWLVKDVVQVDATYGDRFMSDRQHWISIGLRLLTPPFIR